MLMTSVSRLWITVFTQAANGGALSYQPQLLVDETFNRWTSLTELEKWDVFTGNTTVVQLDRRLRKDSPLRRVFPEPIKTADFVYDGDRSIRLELAPNGGPASTIIQKNIAVATKMVPAVAEGMIMSLKANLRLTDPDVILEAQVIGTDEAAAVFFYLEVLREPNAPTYSTQWTTTVTNIAFDIDREGYWEGGSVTFEIPAGVTQLRPNLLIQKASGAMATVDVGRFSLVEQSRRMHAGG